MADLPDSLKKTKDQYLQQFKDDVIAKSQGRLYDFSVSSVLSLIGEAQALSYEKFVSAQTEAFEYISANVLEMMGFTRSKGKKSVCTARFQLSNIIDRNYVILRGYRFSVSNNIVFETKSDLIIPANTDTSNPNNYQYCQVDCVATESGISGNLPPQKAIIITVLPELSSIWIDESKGGQSEETLEAFFSRVSLTISKFLENQYSLVQSSDFELAITQLLGTGSIVVAVPDLSSDGATVEIASMHIFAANSDTSSLTDAQKRELLTNISNRSPLVGNRIYFSDLNIPLVNIAISITVSLSTDSNVISDSINTKLRDVFSVQNTINMNSLELYEAVYQIKLLGALTPVIQWGYVGDVLQARDLPFPKIASGTTETSPIKINQIVVTIEPSGFQKTYLA